MLKGISKIISPELLKLLSEMGHGDEIVIADANFPVEAIGKKVVRADGINGIDMLNAILDLIPLDGYSEKNFILMEFVKGDNIVPTIWEEYKKIGMKDKNFRVGFAERFDFYERAKKAYCIVATGEIAQYANIILKKGIII